MLGKKPNFPDWGTCLDTATPSGLTLLLRFFLNTSVTLGYRAAEYLQMDPQGPAEFAGQDGKPQCRAVWGRSVRAGLFSDVDQAETLIRIDFAVVACAGAGGQAATVMPICP